MLMSRKVSAMPSRSNSSNSLTRSLTERPKRDNLSTTRLEEPKMAWIEIIDEDQAGPDLRDLYEPIVDAKTGRVDEILRIHSLHPAGLAAHTALYKSAMRSTPTLRKVEREMIALVVSEINDCHY